MRARQLAAAALLAATLTGCTATNSAPIPSQTFGSVEQTTPGAAEPGAPASSAASATASSASTPAAAKTASTPTAAKSASPTASKTASPAAESVAPQLKARQLAIPALGIELDYRPAGLTNGWLDLSDDPRVGSWYNQTPQPGSPQGTTIIASHVDYGHGRDVAPFGQLYRAEAGQIATVTDSAGKAWNYRIDSVNVYGRSGIPDAVFTAEGAPRLVMVTCSGKVISGAEQAYYEHNLVVGASLVGPAA